MKTQLPIRRTILAMAIAALAASSPALAVQQEDESKNNNFWEPQPLEVGEVGGGGVATLMGTIGTVTDVDFYSFVAKANSEITIDIDDTHLGPTSEHNITIYVFDGAKNWTFQIDSTEVDAGSQQLEGYPLPYTLDPIIKIPV